MAADADTLTFLFTDIEGSTRLWEEQPEAMRGALQRHDALLRATIEASGGRVWKTVGDAFYAVFPSALPALGATVAAQQVLTAEPWGATPIRVRMALHAGTAEARDADFFGPTLNRVARILAAGHGGQVLCSAAVAELCADGLHQLEGVSLLELGEYTLKGLPRPVRILQARAPGLSSEFPPLRADARSRKLPEQATVLVGRREEVAEARRILAEPTVRLLSLTGPGGTGKTRLALQVAGESGDDFGDGVFFVALAAIRDPALLLPAVMEAVGARDLPGDTPLSSLSRDLVGRRCLLVLDNFEQLVAAAPLVRDLLAACPKVKVLVTSREALHLYGERELPVPALSAPDPRRKVTLEQLAQYDAVRLFIERARAVKPDFAVTNENAPAVAEVCHRLDGLPLPIELAAARVRLLTPQAILARLDKSLPLLVGGARDLPERQQTLRGAIRWSWELLEPDEQATLSRLAVFSGGFSLAAAEAVSADAALHLESLVGKSLVRRVDEKSSPEPRFAMLETIRQFVLETLEASGGAPEARDRMVNHLLAAAPQDFELFGPPQERSLGWIGAEAENLRAAFVWLAERGRVDDALDLAGRTWWWWFVHSHVAELDATIAGLLRHPAAPPSSPGRALARFAQASLRQRSAEVGDAAEVFRECIAFQRPRGDLGHLAAALAGLARVEARSGRLDEATVAIDEAVEVTARTFFPNFWMISVRGQVAAQKGDLDAAAVDFAACVDGSREHSDPSSHAYALASLGLLRTHQGDIAEGRRLLIEALRLRLHSQGDYGIPHMLQGVAATFSDEDPALCVRLAASAAAADPSIRRIPFILDEEVARRIESARSALGDRAESISCAGALLGIDEAVEAAAARSTAQSAA